jgi:phosphopantothenoylcysteine decarboxylase/phosphopantothenate--cysteine ligase
MGFALARRAAARGAEVVLVAGPVALATPPGVERVDVTTALEMQAAVAARAPSAGCVIMAAAVADFRPAAPAARKLKKGEDDARLGALELVANPDILAELAAARLGPPPKDGGAEGPSGGKPILVGFAAETGALDEHARTKLARKKCDLLVGNDVAEPGSGFGGDTNRVTLYAPGAEPERHPLLAKDDAADRVLDRVAKLLAART